MKNVLRPVLFLGLLLSNQHLLSQSWTWDSPTSVNNAQKSIVPDASGNMYLYGYSNLLTWYNSYVDTIIKTTVTGQQLYKKVLPQNMGLVSLVTAPDSNIYISGDFYGTITFGNKTVTSAGSSDIWLAKLDNSGSVLWLKTISGPGDEYLGDICVLGNDLVMTGLMGDTADFMGQSVPKMNNRDLFVAIVSGSGILKKIKIATSTPSSFLTPQSVGRECETDAAGNIYVLANASGINKLDNDTISHLGDHQSTETSFCQTLIKLNSNLQLQFVNVVSECYHYCYQRKNLRVSSSGESYMLEDYYYAQSGNDDMWSTIYKYDINGKAAGKFRVRPDRNSYISDIALDCYDNLYFTGYSRPEYHYNDNYLYSFAVGQLSPSLTLNWLKEDSLTPNFISGNSIGIVGKNDLFINGVYQNTVQLLNTLITGAKGAGFYARIVATGSASCLMTPPPPPTTGINANYTQMVNLFPNPTTGIIFLDGGENAADIQVHSVTGAMVLQKEHSGTIDLREMENGIYYITLREHNGSKKTGKVIVNR